MCIPQVESSLKVFYSKFGQRLKFLKVDKIHGSNSISILKFLIWTHLEIGSSTTYVFQLLFVSLNFAEELSWFFKGFDFFTPKKAPFSVEKFVGRCFRWVSFKLCIEALFKNTWVVQKINVVYYIKKQSVSMRLI